MQSIKVSYGSQSSLIAIPAHKTETRKGLVFEGQTLSHARDVTYAYCIKNVMHTLHLNQFDSSVRIVKFIVTMVTTGL